MTNIEKLELAVKLIKELDQELIKLIESGNPEEAEALAELFDDNSQSRFEFNLTLDY